MRNREKPFGEKIVTADEAVAAICNGDFVVFSHAAGVPQEIPQALIRNKDRFRDVHIYHMLCLGDGEYLSEGLEDHFRHITNFVGTNSRKAIEQGRADFMPCFFFEIPYMFRRKQLPVGVAVIHVTPPDVMGNCSFGVSCDYTKPAAEEARVVIAEMNENMPCVGGDNFIHISQIDNRRILCRTDREWFYSATRHRSHSRCGTYEPYRQERPRYPYRNVYRRSNRFGRKGCYQWK